VFTKFLIDYQKTKDHIAKMEMEGY